MLFLGACYQDQCEIHSCVQTSKHKRRFMNRGVTPLTFTVEVG